MRTKISHGSKIKSGDIKNIASDLSLRVDEVIPYMRCAVNNETYLDRLIEKGLIEENN